MPTAKEDCVFVSEKNIEVIGRLLALLAHDLRNPLSALHSNLGFLAAVLEHPEPDVSDAISDGLISCEGVGHIIDNMDLLGQSLRGHEERAADRIVLPAFVSEVVAGCRTLCDSHGLSIEVVNELPGKTVTVSANRELLSRALSNLVRNSIQHAPSGSVVRLFLTATEHGARVRVVDVGLEIDPREAESLFSAEGQLAAKSSHSGRYSRGMGLFAARLAADAAGANIALSGAVEGYSNSFTLEVAVAREGGG